MQRPDRGAISKACSALPQCENVPYGPCVIDPRLARRGRQFVAFGRDHERHGPAHALIGILHDHQIFVGRQSRIMHGELVRSHRARLQTGQVGPTARRRVLRDEDQRVRLKVLALHGEIDFLRLHAGPGHACHRSVRRHRCRQRSGIRARTTARPFERTRTVQLPGWEAGAKSGDRKLRGEAHLRRHSGALRTLPSWRPRRPGPAIPRAIGRRPAPAGPGTTGTPADRSAETSRPLWERGRIPRSPRPQRGCL